MIRLALKISMLALFSALVLMSTRVVEGQEKVLYSFTGAPDGAGPQNGLVFDKAGNIYGTARFGGNAGCGGGCGIVFKLTPSSGGKWAETILHTFAGAPDGEQPYGGLVLDASGNIYGTTTNGGLYGWGTIYKVDTSGNETVLYNFLGGVDGGIPTDLVIDKAGNLYGTTTEYPYGYGNVFKFDTTGHETVLYTFAGPPDGQSPYGRLLLDSSGNIYGVTGNGGNDCKYPVISGCGTVYELTPTGRGGWTEAVLYRFTGGTDGGYPISGLIKDASGNLYGTTYFGGNPGCDLQEGCGVVYKLDVGRNESVLYSFTGGTDGSNPSRSLLQDSAGNFYSTTYRGGTNNSGTVFELTPNGQETLLYTFTGGTDGGNPESYLISDSGGNLYGTTYAGGTTGAGTVFEFARPWLPLKNQPCSAASQPCFSASTALLLTDGTVMIQSYCSPSWYQLTPDNTGSYLNGTWTTLATSPYGPLYYASAVLGDGKVIIEGGEYMNVQGGCSSSPVDTSLGAIYDPAVNSWSNVNPPNGWAMVGDASSAVLPDLTFMLGACCSKQQALLDESTLSWTATGAGKLDNNSEEGWTLLPDGDLLVVDTEDGTHSELYNPSSGSWSPAVGTVVKLTNICLAGYVPEVGPAMLRPDGTILAVGATNSMAVYHISTGTWSRGPIFQGGVGVADGPAALLPDGNVLLMASQVPPVGQCYTSPSQFFEVNGNALTQVTGPPNSAIDASFEGRMLLLPTGQVLFTDGSSDIEVYTSPGLAKGNWAPTIKSWPATIVRGQTDYSISGTQFNGLSQAVAYGDDAQAATNYPLVRITNTATKHVCYAKTHDHSTMAVATGSNLVSTYFDTTSCLEAGAGKLVVVANGIASAPVAVNVQ